MALKVGVVGMSGIGNNHANCHANDDLAELVAVCDIAKARADSAAERLGVKAYYSLADMIDGEPDLDIVDVTTGGNENGSWHYEPTMEALDNGKHVLVEKPISNDIGQAREMVAKATEEDLYLGCNLNHYFTPPQSKQRNIYTMYIFASKFIVSTKWYSLSVNSTIVIQKPHVLMDFLTST